MNAPKSEIQNDLLATLNEIEDPELGIGIVDLGLIYRAEWTESGIDVEFTMTAPSDRKSTRLNSSHIQKSRMPSSA